MRGDSGSAQEKVRRAANDLLQGDSLKLVNMLELARELSGEAEAPAPKETGANPAEFWKRKLSGWTIPTPVAVTIPPEEPGPPRGALASHSIPAHEAERLREFAEHIGIPISILFHAGWALLLHRYSGVDDVVFGLVKSCVERDDAAEHVAPHIVPSRVIFEPQFRVRAWLRAVATQCAAAAPFEFASLEQIRAAAEIPSDTGLFESVLSIGNDLFEPLSVMRMPEQDAAGGGACGLAAAVYFSRDISLRLGYRADRFAETAATRILEHWSTLLRSMAAAPDEVLTALPLLGKQERQQLVDAFNETQAPYPSDSCVHHLFEQQVERTPDAVALTFQGESLTYRQLNYRANELAHHLRSLGVGPDVVVGICLQRSTSMIVSVLAVLKAGGAYLPLDPAYPHERLQFMIEDARALVLLTETKLEAIFPQRPNHLIRLDTDWSQGLRLHHENPGNLTRPEHLAYVIYTSGSTGKPKGVAMIHRPLVNLIDWQNKDSRVQARSKTLQFTSLSFDVSFQETIATLSSGGTLVLITAELRLSPRELWAFIVQQGIARIFLPFVALQQLADAAAAEGTTATELREVITAGEQLQVTTKLRDLFARHPQATLHNHYGPSETHVVTALTLRGDPQQWPALPSIGRPIQNTQIFILDRHFAPAPLGIPGELYIGGVPLARGYLERPDVTAEKFIAHPLTGDEKDRVYKTGDLARYLPNGEIEFLGRIDHQVKIRGYRVELGEIEALLNKLPGVSESVVIAREPAPGNKQLVAYLVLAKNSSLDPQELRDELKQHLPEYMLPATFVFLDQLPLTPSGKVDRKSLPAPDAAPEATAPREPGERPWLPIQLQLVQLWEEILNVRPIGIRDSFFEAGGHSLLAVKMMDRVEQLTGTKLPVTALFEEPTIAHLAELILARELHLPNPVVELQAHGERIPIYFLHGDIIGGGFYARKLATLLGDSQPFYVLPPTELPDNSLPTVEEMATVHLAHLRAHRPHGPYIFGGFCIGAHIAYEMAIRLRAAGEEVPWIALIDPQLASSLLHTHYRLVKRIGEKRGYTAQRKVRMFARGYKLLFRLREEWNAPFAEKMRFVLGRARRLFMSARAPSGQAGNGAEAGTVEDREQLILGTLNWILSAYEPPPYDGDLAVFVTDEQRELTPFLPRRWKRTAPNAEIELVPGGHLDTITTDLHVLAGKLKERLDRVNARRAAHATAAMREPASR